jgi:hypothetical protein
VTAKWTVVLNSNQCSCSDKNFLRANRRNANKTFGAIGVWRGVSKGVEDGRRELALRAATPETAVRSGHLQGTEK